MKSSNLTSKVRHYVVKYSLFNFQGPTLKEIWGYSSAGRAPALQAGGQRFDPAYLHHVPKRYKKRLEREESKAGNMGL